MRLTSTGIPGSGSVLVCEHHVGGGTTALAAQLVGDHPDGALLLGLVVGEQPAFCLSVVGIVGGLVFGIEIAPVAGGMAIEQVN